MVLLAIFPWAYGFYQLLRIVICVFSAIVAYSFYKSKLSGWALAFVAIALVFNPFFPVYMAKASWIGIDIVVGIVFFIASGAVREEIVD